MFFGAYTAISGVFLDPDITKFIGFANPTNILSTLILYFFVILGFITGVKTYKPKLIESLSNPILRTLFIFVVALFSSFLYIYMTNYINYAAYVLGIEPNINLFFSVFLLGTFVGVIGAMVTDLLS